MSTYRNAGLFVLLSFLWGSSFMAIKAGLEFLPPVLFAAVRYDIAEIMLRRPAGLLGATSSRRG